MYGSEHGERNQASLHLSNIVVVAFWNGPEGLVMEPHCYCLLMVWLLMEGAGELGGVQIWTPTASQKLHSWEERAQQWGEKNKTKWNILKAPELISIEAFFSVIDAFLVFNYKRVLTVCGHRHQDAAKEQDRCCICRKPVFEQEKNAKQATAKQAPESSPAERDELETLAGTTEAAQKHVTWIKIYI